LPRDFERQVRIFDFLLRNKAAPKTAADGKDALLDFSGLGPISEWTAPGHLLGQSDILAGMEFCATMQLRTPLRVLLHHGELHTDLSASPPCYVKDQWEGIWVPALKTWAELGIAAKDIPPGTVASDIGPVPEDGGDYLPFLLKVRGIVEADLSIEQRINELECCEFSASDKKCIDLLGGLDGIIERLFPKFLYLGPDLDTPNKISAASDDALLNISGVGPAKLKKIRALCAGVLDGRDSDRVDRVNR